DGSITDIPREDYLEAEGRVIRELQEIGKPFLVLLNAVDPKSSRVQAMASDIASTMACAVCRSTAWSWTTRRWGISSRRSSTSSR
ncbi:MAG: hypothetical protein ACLS8S_09440, partial [Oscillospiraceae bacterium]